MIYLRPILVTVALLTGLGGRAALNAAQPNCVVIMAEAQGSTQTSVQMDDLLPESKSRVFITPSLERLAREGMRFAYGYAASPRCTPSRAALFTGKSPAALHMTYVGVDRSPGPVRTKLIPPEPLLELPTGEVTVAELLKTAGYTTAHFGKWHVGRVAPSRHGFDASDGATNNGGPDGVANPNPEQADSMTRRGIAFMAAAKESEKPFYLQLSHYPNQERRGAAGGRDPAIIRAEVADIDRTVGQVLDALDSLKLTGNTFVFYTSDHGGQGREANAPLAGGKGAVTEGGLRVPFLVRGPGVSANICSRVPVVGFDFLPTVVALAGSVEPLPVGVEGGSLVAVLRDPQGRGTVTRAREELVFHFPHYDMGNGGPATAILLGGYKLVRNYEAGALRLYHLERDPGESKDLASKMGAKTRDLEARLDAYLQDVSAQLSRPNPQYDPAQAASSDEGPTRKGGKTGKRRDNP